MALISVVQVIAVVFALFAGSRAVLRFKYRQISSKEFIFWSIIWISVIVVALIPGITGMISRFMGVKRPIDVAVYLGLIVLFYLIFRLYVKVESIEGSITKLVRELAMMKRKKK